MIRSKLSRLFWALPIRVRIFVVKCRPRYVWFLASGPFFEAHTRVQFWIHRGDGDSEWWCPARHEVVTTCMNLRGVVQRVDPANRFAYVLCSDGVERRVHWPQCLEPGDRVAERSHG